MCQEPVKGDFGFARAFAIALFHFALVLIGVLFHGWPLFGEIRNHPLTKRLLLKLPLQKPSIQEEAVLGLIFWHPKVCLIRSFV